MSELLKDNRIQQSILVNRGHLWQPASRCLLLSNVNPERFDCQRPLSNNRSI